MEDAITRKHFVPIDCVEELTFEVVDLVTDASVVVVATVAMLEICSAVDVVGFRSDRICEENDRTEHDNFNCANLIAASAADFSSPEAIDFSS